MQCIKVVADDALLAAYPSSWPARVVVITKSGRYESRVRDIPGDPTRPFREADINDKFQSVVAPLLGEQTAAFLQAGLTVLNSRSSFSTVMQHLSRFISRVHEPAEAPTAR
ncbi:MAG: hypothetical protein WBD71_12145 [Xanthobacteraceae bacterium]